MIKIKRALLRRRCMPAMFRERSGGADAKEHEAAQHSQQTRWRRGHPNPGGLQRAADHHQTPRNSNQPKSPHQSQLTIMAYGCILGHRVVLLRA